MAASTELPTRASDRVSASYLRPVNDTSILKSGLCGDEQRLSRGGAIRDDLYEYLSKKRRRMG
jgi:hypothetical protein